MVHAIKDKVPIIDQSAFIAHNAEVAGDVVIEQDCSVWFSATLRGDLESITVQRGSNIQDNAVVHTDIGEPCVIESMVTVGHGAILHSCIIKTGSTIGMGAIILNGAIIPPNSMVAAGSVVPPQKTYPPNSLIMGSPAKAVRQLRPEELEGMKKNTENYIKHAHEAQHDYIIV